MKSRRTIWIAALFFGAATFYGGWLAYLAHRDLVTLSVRNMEVRDVLKKVERQTWRSISLKSFVEQRRAFLLEHPELKKGHAPVLGPK